MPAYLIHAIMADEFLKRVKGDFHTEIYNILSEPFR